MKSNSVCIFENEGKGLLSYSRCGIRGNVHNRDAVFVAGVAVNDVIARGKKGNSGSKPPMPEKKKAAFAKKRAAKK